ncbi:pyridoxal phosphate-dependent decarboxylase family protein [Phenylobacterium sp.]|uniref:pyridoxal phosphate-dependent decarboxylase family protein n=1 Tax=Phenylobacterium sp. TaxID=1871053 RepID=UPI002DEA3571|nr:pyridoxal-dependent decarboxylase [Phenylobacterium sp.]
MNLDPDDWSDLRDQGHGLMDAILGHIETLRDQPLWRAPPDELRASFREPLPHAPTPIAAVGRTFVETVLPYSSGNAHPGFMGWVQGGGTTAGMLGEMLAAGLNANLGGRDHMALEVEQQVLAWTRQMFGFPQTASGLFVTGASQANFMAVLIARLRALGPSVRTAGVGAAPLIAYASRAVHGCVSRAMDMSGIGAGQLRLVPTDAAGAIRIDVLAQAIAADRAAGLRPFLIVGSAGTVDIGAVDDLDGLADLAAAEDLHFHVDGALGALGVLAPSLAPKFKGLERACSIAFDWHKWGQTPYDAGFLLVRDAELHRSAFAGEAAYLSRADRGLAGGDWWPCDYGPDLSRGFRALKTWFTLKTYGVDALGQVIAQTCDLAAELAARIEAEPELELMAPVALNVVCFRYRGPTPGAAAEDLNAQIVADLQIAGQVAPSLTRLDGRTAIRAAIVNHRTERRDIETLVSSVLALGRTASQRRAA